MNEPNFVELVLACGSWQEAQRITDALLAKNLAVSIELMEVKIKDQLQAADQNEVKLIIQTRADLFDKIETVVKKLHSHQVPVLHAVPVVKIAGQAAAWPKEEIK